MAPTILPLATVEVQELSVDGTDSEIGRVWLNCAKNHNALNNQVLQNIIHAFTFLQTRFDINIVILAGRGKSFCAGAHLKNAPGAALEVSDRKLGGRERRHAARLGRRAVAAIENLEAVTIAQVHGHAVGGGFGLMQACDLRLCCRTARLCYPEVNIKVPLAWGLTARLLRDVGRAKAMELIALCEDLPPRTVETLGFVNRLLDDGGGLEAAAIEWASELARQHGVAHHIMKTQFRALSWSTDLGDVTEGDNDYLLLGQALRSNL